MTEILTVANLCCPDEVETGIMFLFIIVKRLRGVFLWYRFIYNYIRNKKFRVEKLSIFLRLGRVTGNRGFVFGRTYLSQKPTRILRFLKYEAVDINQIAKLKGKFRITNSETLITSILENAHCLKSL